MGLYDNLHKINTTLSSERVERQKERERKKLLKQLQEDFKAELLELLILLYLQKSPIYTNEARYKNVDIVIQNYIEKNKKEKEFWIFQKFIPFYKNDILHYLHNNYYTIASKSERIAKKRINFELQDIELQEIELERQEKELAKQQKEAEKIARQKAKLKQERIIKLNKAIDITGIALCKFLAIFGYIALQVLLAIFSFFVGFLKGLFGSAMKTKKW